MYFTEEDKKVYEEYVKHFKINIFENSAYVDQHKCLKLLESSLLDFSMLMRINSYFRNKHHILANKIHNKCHVFEVWQDLSRFLNFIDKLHKLDYASRTAKKEIINEALKWLKPFIHLVMIFTAKA